jgi:hypothetical protein
MEPRTYWDLLAERNAIGALIKSDTLSTRARRLAQSAWHELNEEIETLADKHALVAA